MDSTGNDYLLNYWKDDHNRDISISQLCEEINIRGTKTYNI